MPTFVEYKDIVEANGKTIKENNLAKGHAIPIGTLVEVNIPYSDYHRMRLYVVANSRDCDGTPLYLLGHKGAKYINPNEITDPTEKGIARLMNMSLYDGFSDDSLIIIEENKAETLDNLEEH